MANPTYWELEREYYSLVDDYDLIIRVIEQEERTRTEGQAPNIRNIKEHFTKLVGGGFREGQQSVIDLKEDCAEAVQGVIIWLQILHGNDFTHAIVDIRSVWEMLAAAHKYGLDPESKAAKAWFNHWYNDYKTGSNGKEVEFEDYQMLLFPCHTFDHAQGFATATKCLVYRASGHIVEARPEGFTHDHLRLDQRVIQQVNAAKGRLKTILHRLLYDPISKLLKFANCDDKEKVLYAYEKALTDTGAWPLETAYVRQSMHTILWKLSRFPDGRDSKLGGHAYCSFSFSDTVEMSSNQTKDYFDGLCLDCMKHSKFGDADRDYWRHADQGVRWDNDCRVTHDQPTWYFSFMGRREKMIKWTQRNRNDD